MTNVVSVMGATFVHLGLTMSTKKTRVLVVGWDAAITEHCHQRDKLEVVFQFKYLGTIFTSDSTLEIASRIASASGAFARLHKAELWTAKALPLTTRLQFLQCIVMFLLYGGETWSFLTKHFAKAWSLVCVSHAVFETHLR